MDKALYNNMFWDHSHLEIFKLAIKFAEQPRILLTTLAWPFTIPIYNTFLGWLIACCTILTSQIFTCSILHDTILYWKAIKLNPLLSLGILTKCRAHLRLPHYIPNRANDLWKFLYYKHQDVSREIYSLYTRCEIVNWNLKDFGHIYTRLCITVATCYGDIAWVGTNRDTTGTAQ